MRTVSSFEELSPLLSAQLRPGLRTNAFASPEALRREIAGGRLRIEETEAGLLLFRDRGSFQRMSFCLRGPLTLPEPEKTTVVEIPLRERDTALRETAEDFERQGYRLLLRRQRMTRPAGPALPAPHAAFAARPAQPGDLDAALALLNGNFDPLTGCLPEPDELLASLEAGDILLAETEGIAAGLLHIGPGRGSTELRHLAVSAPYRRRGAAASLLALYLARRGDVRSTVWVRQDNLPAIRLYAAWGYVPDGFSSLVLAKTI